MTLPPKTLPIAVLLLLTLAWFGALDYRDLIKPDEGRYAEIAREMARSGDWITPRLNDLKYFEKPPFQYWMTAVAFQLLGESAWTARLWSALSGFACIACVAFAGQRLFGKEAGEAAALVLTSSLLFVLIGHINTLDMGVTLFMTLGLCSFMLGAASQRPRKWMLATWAALAGAVLSKGLMGIVLPGAVLCLYLLWHRDWALFTKLEWLRGGVLFLAITAPWFIAVSIQNPEFARFFFIHEHFERFLTTSHRREAPWWEFIPVLAAGILPWLLPLFPALLSGLPAGPTSFQPQRFLLLWCVFIFIFFSFSGSKLPSYILPIFPALALLIGRYLARTDGRHLFWLMLPLPSISILAWMLSNRLDRLGDNAVEQALYASYAPWINGAGTLWLIGCASGLLLAWAQKTRTVRLVFAATGLAAALVLLNGHQSLAPVKSSRLLAEGIRPHLSTETRLYMAGFYDQTLPFYLQRTFTLVDYRDELGFGADQEPGKAITGSQAFLSEWNNTPRAMAVIHPDYHTRKLPQLPPGRILVNDYQRIVIIKP